MAPCEGWEERAAKLRRRQRGLGEGKGEGEHERDCEGEENVREKCKRKS